MLAPFAALAVDEFADWCPRLARGLVRWSARRLGDGQVRERYEEEYLASLNDVEGRVCKLLAALGYAMNVPRMRWALRAERRDQAEPAEQSARDTPVRFISIY